MQQMWQDVNEGLEGDYDPEKVAGDLEDLDVGPEAMEAMEAAGFLGDEGIEYFDQAMDADLGEDTIAQVQATSNGDYTLLVDENFYELYDQEGLIDAAEAMRHEYNHARDFEGDLLPDLREDGTLDPVSAYIIGLNLEGDRESMEGANQYITELENPYNLLTNMEAYPEEKQAVADQIKEYLPEMSEDIEEQLEEQGLDELEYNGDDIEVYDVEVEDGKYIESGEIDGEEYEIELDMPSIDYSSAEV